MQGHYFHFSVLFSCICYAMCSSLVFDSVHLDLGVNLGGRVAIQVRKHLQSANIAVYDFSQDDASKLSSRSLILALGNSSLSQRFLPDLSSLPDESFSLVVRQHSSGAVFLAGDGTPLRPDTHKNVSFNKDMVHYGAVVGCYKVLELLGFAFLHPLSATIPRRLTLPSDLVEKSMNITESPYWPERGFHYHTQHPLELTEVMQGFDIPQFGPHGPECYDQFHHKNNKRRKSNDDCPASYDSPSPHPHTRHPYSIIDTFFERWFGLTRSHPSAPPADTPYCERWEDMVEEMNSLFEWCAANRLNKIEWLLLGNYKWGKDLDTRQNRMKILTDLGHQYSIMVGANSPLGNVQQHGWFMVDTSLSMLQQAEQIKERVDWVFNAGFDFLTTESGSSEFHHPECDLMVDLMNAYAEYVNGTWGREAGIKVHCSTGQVCEEYPDPRTGEPVNFNFLTMFATNKLGIFPHTIQPYSLRDPTAGVYGNADFQHMEDYLVYESKLGNRSVIYYGETSYWVNVDIDVPLFLPLYGQRRLQDLRHIAAREQKEGFRMRGQMNFDSGWEWGYWLNNIVTARASWDVMPDIPEGNDWLAYEAALEPLLRIFDDADKSFVYRTDNGIMSHHGDSIRQMVLQTILKLTKAQEEILIFGRVKGKPSPNLEKLSGLGYIEGSDTWIELPRMFGLPLLQPNKVHLRENDDEDWKYVLPLLNEMEQTFEPLAKQFSAFYEIILQKNIEYVDHREKQNSDPLEFQYDEYSGLLSDSAMDILEEIKDCVDMFSLRVGHVRRLYQSMDQRSDDEDTALLQSQSREILGNAASIVKNREDNYRVPWQRVAGWRENPTVYRYGYLWSVHSLYYWWRDQGLAEQGSIQSSRSPCYLNRMDTTEVAMGWGKFSLEVLRAAVNRFSPFTLGYPLELVNCLAPPPREYMFPKDLYAMDFH